MGVGVRPNPELAGQIVLLCEQIEAQMPHQRKPAYYIDPVVNWMTIEWRSIKRRIVDDVVAALSVQPVGVPVDELFDIEDLLPGGVEIGLPIAMPEVGSIPLLEAKTPKLPRMGMGKVRDAKGNLVDIFFDRLGIGEFADMQANWRSIPFETHFESATKAKAGIRAIVAKDAGGNVQGACIYSITGKGDVSIDFLATNPANIGKGKGLSGIGSDLLARAGLDVKPDAKLSLLSRAESTGFYERVGMVKLEEFKGAATFEFSYDSAQGFANKMGVSKSAEFKAVKEAGEVIVDPARKKTMEKQLQTIMAKFKADTAGKVSEAINIAQSDTVPTLVARQTNVVTIKLSKEGMEEVVAGLSFQSDFVDDLSLSVPKRIDRILEGRYGAISDVRDNLNRAFRIDRDRVLGDFRDEVGRIADKMIDGRITPTQFESQMENSIRRHYAKIYREGKGTPLAKWERDFIERQVESQRQYLSNFKNFIEAKKATGQELTGYVKYRADLYAQRGTAIFETAHVSTLPDDVLLNWTLHPAEHCGVCPIFAANSPYTKATLPGYPGEGFHLTPCGVNCVCTLDVSEIYARPVPEEGTLAQVREDAVISGDTDIVNDYMANEKEYGIIFDENWDRLVEKRGEFQAIEFTTAECQTIKDSVTPLMTHYHPNGSAFSGDDIAFAATNGIDEMRIVSERYTYNMKPEISWPESKTIRVAYEREKAVLTPKYTERFQLMGDSGARWREHSHEIWENLGEEFKLQYRRELR